MGKRKTIVIVAEGAHDAQLKPIHAEYVKNVLADRLGLDTRVTTLGHTQRGGRPCAFDRIMVCLPRAVLYDAHRSVTTSLPGAQPTLQGLDAVDALLEATPQTPSYMIGVRENKIHRVPLMEAVAMVLSLSLSPSFLSVFGYLYIPKRPPLCVTDARRDSGDHGKRFREGHVAPRSRVPRESGRLSYDVCAGYQPVARRAGTPLFSLEAPRAVFWYETREDVGHILLLLDQNIS